MVNQKKSIKRKIALGEEELTRGCCKKNGLMQTELKAQLFFSFLSGVRDFSHNYEPQR